MPSILKRAQQSKLHTVNINQEKLFLLNRRSYSIVRSFRLDDQTWQDLRDLLEKTNHLTRNKITSTRLIKALIHLGKNTPEQALIKSLKEIAV